VSEAKTSRRDFVHRNIKARMRGSMMNYVDGFGNDLTNEELGAITRYTLWLANQSKGWLNDDGTINIPPNPTFDANGGDE